MTLPKKKQDLKIHQDNNVMSQNDVAIILGVSRQAIQVTEKRALKKIRKKLLNLYTETDLRQFIANRIAKSLP